MENNVCVSHNSVSQGSSLALTENHFVRMETIILFFS